MQHNRPCSFLVWPGCFSVAEGGGVLAASPLQVLWPSLLGFVTPVPLTNALAPLCKSLLALAAQKQEQGDSDLQLLYDPGGSYWPLWGKGGLRDSPWGGTEESLAAGWLSSSSGRPGCSRSLASGGAGWGHGAAPPRMPF